MRRNRWSTKRRNKAKQNKSNRMRRANAVAKHKQRGGGAWIRARTGSRIPRPCPPDSPRISFEQTTPRRIPEPHARSSRFGRIASAHLVRGADGGASKPLLRLAWLNEPSATASQPRLACRAVGFGRSALQRRGGRGRGGEFEDRGWRLEANRRRGVRLKRESKDGRIRGGG